MSPQTVTRRDVMERGVRAAILTIAIAALPVGVWSAEGRFPIAGPRILGAPGHYIVTRNITLTSGDGIIITAVGVTLDLNGHVLSSTASDNKLIRIEPTADLVTIRGGWLSGGEFGIYGASTVGLTLKMDNLEVDGTASTGNAVYLSGAAHVEILHSRLFNNSHAIFVEGLSGQPVTGRIEGNLVAGGEIALLRARNMQIRDNVIRGTCTTGLQIGLGAGPSSAYGGNLIQGNTITGCSSVGINVLPNAPGNRITGNVLQNDPIAILVQSASNQVVRNTIYGSTSAAPCGGGICVLEAPHNLIEANLIAGSSPGCAIRFFGAAAIGNSYRDNMLRDNFGGGACFDGGGAASNDGGNIF